MEFVAARCPNCGGELRLPNDKQQLKCIYCGAEILVRDAIKQAVPNIENLLGLARLAETNRNYQEAYDYFTKVLEFDVCNASAHLGKGLAAGYLSTPKNFREQEVVSGIENALKNTGEEGTSALKSEIAEKILLLTKHYGMLCAFNRDTTSLQQSQFNELKCLKLAHAYNPQDTLILTLIYTMHRGFYRIAKAQHRLRQTSNQNENDPLASIYIESMESNESLAESWLEKLIEVDPTKAEEVYKSQQKSEAESDDATKELFALREGGQTKSQPHHYKNAGTKDLGCLVTILQAILLALIIGTLCLLT